MRRRFGEAVVLRVPVGDDEPDREVPGLVREPTLARRERLVLVLERTGVQLDERELGRVIHVREAREVGFGREVVALGRVEVALVAREVTERHVRAEVAAAGREPGLPELDRARGIAVQERELGAQETASAASRPRRSAAVANACSASIERPSWNALHATVVHPSAQARRSSSALRRLFRELELQPPAGRRVPVRLDVETGDAVRDERRELPIHVFGRLLEHLVERAVEVEPAVERLEQPHHRREPVLGDQHLAEQAALVVTEQNPRSAERAVQLAHRDQVVVRVGVDEVLAHRPRPRGPAGRFLPGREPLGDPARAAVVRQPEVHDVRELVERGARPRERAAQLRQRRDRGDDRPEADAERREALVAGRAHREVLVLPEHLDLDVFGRVAVAGRELLARLGVETASSTCAGSRPRRRSTRTTAAPDRPPRGSSRAGEARVACCCARRSCARAPRSRPDRTRCAPRPRRRCLRARARAASTPRSRAGRVRPPRGRTAPPRRSGTAHTGCGRARAPADCRPAPRRAARRAARARRRGRARPTRAPPRASAPRGAWARARRARRAARARRRAGRPRGPRSRRRAGLRPNAGSRPGAPRGIRAATAACGASSGARPETARAARPSCVACSDLACRSSGPPSRPLASAWSISPSTSRYRLAVSTSTSGSGPSPSCAARCAARSVCDAPTRSPSRRWQRAHANSSGHVAPVAVRVPSANASSAAASCPDSQRTRPTSHASRGSRTGSRSAPPSVTSSAASSTRPSVIRSSQSSRRAAARSARPSAPGRSARPSSARRKSGLGLGETAFVAQTARATEPALGVGRLVLDVLVETRRALAGAHRGDGRAPLAPARRRAALRARRPARPGSRPERTGRRARRASGSIVGRTSSVWVLSLESLAPAPALRYPGAT